MDWDEHIMLISHTVNVFRDNLLVIGNTGSNSTREALHATEQGFAVGMHASLQINPYYGKTSAAGLGLPSLASCTIASSSCIAGCTSCTLPSLVGVRPVESLHTNDTGT